MLGLSHSIFLSRFRNQNHPQTPARVIRSPRIFLRPDAHEKISRVVLAVSMRFVSLISYFVIAKYPIIKLRFYMTADTGARHYGKVQVLDSSGLSQGVQIKKKIIAM